MKFIPVPVPGKLARFVNGQIVWSVDHRVLSQDMVEVDLPSGVMIHAGWYGDLSGGAYRIYVDRGLTHLIPYLECDDPYQAANDVASLAEVYSRDESVVSGAEASASRGRIAFAHTRQFALVG